MGARVGTGRMAAMAELQSLLSSTEQGALGWGCMEFLVEKLPGSYLGAKQRGSTPEAS